MSMDPEQNGGRFERFMELPPEIRMMIINKMTPQARCQLSAVSQICLKETRKSPNYIFGLGLAVVTAQYSPVDKFEIHVRITDVPNQEGIPNGFNLCMVEEADKKYMIYKSSPSGRELARLELDPSTDLIQYTIENFKERLHMFHNTIKQMYILGDVFETQMRDYDFEVTSFINLTILEADSGVNVLPIFEGLRKPLTAFQYWENTTTIPPAIFDQVCQVKCHLGLGSVKLTYAQFLQLNAKYLAIPIGHMTEVDIFDFIHTWKNGTIRDNFEKCVWDIGNFEFNEKELFRLFGEDSDYGDIFVVKHNLDATKTACVRTYAQRAMLELEFSLFPVLQTPEVIAHEEIENQ